jgi:hypothetical protein
MKHTRKLYHPHLKILSMAATFLYDWGAKTYLDNSLILPLPRAAISSHHRGLKFELINNNIISSIDIYYKYSHSF